MAVERLQTLLARIPCGSFAPKSSLRIRAYVNSFSATRAKATPVLGVALVGGIDRMNGYHAKRIPLQFAPHMRDGPWQITVAVQTTLSHHRQCTTTGWSFVFGSASPYIRPAR